MATYTGSAATAGAQPRVVTPGVFSLALSFTQGAAISISDVVLLAKIPNKATVLGWESTFFTGADTQALALLRVGTTAIGATITGSATATFRHGSANIGENLPLKVSLSDDAAVLYQFLNLQILTGTTATATLAFRCVVYLTMDNP